MKFIFFDKGNEGGVYKIININNSRIYIGSTSRFKTRAYSHSNNLEANRHLNKFMQNDFNKSGTDSFLFEVLEVVIGGKKERLEREQFYIDQWYDNQKNCYNLAKEAQDTRGGTRNKKQIDPQTDGRCKPFSEERLLKHTTKLKETWQDPELKEVSRKNGFKKWNNHSANITVTNKITGEKVIITGSVRQFCLERNLSYKAFNQLVKGKIKSSGGWFMGEVEPEYNSQKGEVRKPLSKEHRDKISGGKYVGIKLINDQGMELILGVNIKNQCRELNICYSTLLKVLNGTCKNVSGYYLE